jgi:hypothetical protein
MILPANNLLLQQCREIAREGAEFKQLPERADGIQHAKLVGDDLEIRGDEVSVPGAGDIDNIGIGDAGHAQADAGRAIGAAIRAGLRDLDQLFHRGWRLWKSALGKDFGIPVQPRRGMTDRNGN